MKLKSGSVDIMYICPYIKIIVMNKMPNMISEDTIKKLRIFKGC